MPQVYHSNARTNQHAREIIQKSNLANVEFARHYSLNVELNVCLRGEIVSLQ